MQVGQGDVIEVASRQVGGQVRRGTVVIVVSEEPLELTVAWDDGHESNFYPAAGNARVVEAHDA